MIEVIRKADGSTILVRCKGGDLLIAPEFTVGSITYVAADVGSGIPAELALATTVGDPELSDALVQDVTDVVCSLTGVSASAAELGAFFACGTQFADSLNPTLRVALTGGDGMQMSWFLKVLSCFTRHSLPVAVFSHDYLSSLASGCTPTLLVSHPMLSSDTVRLMIATQDAGFAVPRNGEMLNRPYSAVILGEELKVDLPDSFLWIDVTPERRPKRLDTAELRQIRDKYQSRGLRYRFETWPKISAAGLDIGDLAGSTGAVAAAMASVFPDCQNLQQRVFQAFKPLDEARRLAASVSQPVVVLDAMLILCHEDKAAVRIGEITEVVNGILDMRSDGYRLSAHRVGSIVKAFGLIAVRDNRGYKLTLTSAVKRHIHELGRSADVPFFKGQFQLCEFCDGTSTRPKK